MILTVTPNPCVDKTLFTGPVQLGAKIRAPRWTCIAGGKGCNVSRAVKVMGGSTSAMVLTGGPTGQHVVDMLEEADGIPVIAEIKRASPSKGHLSDIPDPAAPARAG